MPPTRRAVSNGRSPLVRKQSAVSNDRSPLVRKHSQFTTFFSTGKTPNPSSNTNTNPNPPKEKRKNTHLTIPSPSNSNSKTPSSNPNPKTPLTTKVKSYAEEVIGRMIRVFCPLNKAWYEGNVNSFDRLTGKHLIQYEDGKEHVLDLEKEKIELVQEEEPIKLRRLRRMPTMEEKDADDCDDDDDSDDDDSDDEDWGKEMDKNVEDYDSEEVELEENEEEDVVVKRSSSGLGRSSCAVPGKRKKVDAEKLGCNKKFRFDGEAEEGCLRVTPASKRRSCVGLTMEDGLQLDNSCSNLTGAAAERFGKREVEKFKFLGKGRKDVQGRRPGDAEYDPRTLYLPHDFLRSLSGGQRQWWEFKAMHMDKVLFFKMGKFYEMFEMDAHIGAKELDLQYMKGEQPHCGFPEKNFLMHLEKLARKGYRVLVVEQVETPEQLALRRKQMGSKDKVVKREICAMVTKGTLTEGESLLTNPDPSYLMSITEQSNAFANQIKEDKVIGICLVDVSTSKFMVGQLEDDADYHRLCSILSELRPVEIVKPSGLLRSETEKVLKNYTRNPLINSLIPSLEFWDAERTIDEVKKLFRASELLSGVNGGPSADSEILDNNCSWILPDVLSELIRAGHNGHCGLSAFGGCLFYLRQAFLDESLLKCAKFERLPCAGLFNSVQKTHMILDATALENLEILENNRNGSPSGTLFEQLDHCVTPFGKRLLKTWLARPLYNTSFIGERQDAILGIKGAGLAVVPEFRKALGRLPDMERLFARIFTRCGANGRNANQVVLYEDSSKRHIQEFIAALRGCQVMLQACSSLSSLLGSTESTLLHHLLTPGKGLPDISSILKHFKDAFDWTDADHSGRIIPCEGGDTEYDIACRTVKEAESSLMCYLQEQRILLGDPSITYVTVGKDSYLLEVPQRLNSSVPQEYELCSSKKGYVRYRTPKIRNYLSELAEAEVGRESKLKNIFHRLVCKFSEHHGRWRQLVSVTSELDVLISVSIAADYYEGPSCRPIFKEICESKDQVPYLSATSLGHPVLQRKGSFVPNDVRIGGAGHSSFILVTGPNMGGKSTLLRQVCMAVILAQIGADVPAESFELTSVDHIFVRMGARDLIMAGQSTFLLELSETASMLSRATQNSLVALDELGRGTSTSDGQAIAGSVLDYLVHKIQCRGLFSTHYHRLAVEYENNAKVSLSHMACQVDGVNQVTFLYKLIPGSCPKSYGANVARLAGIPHSVLEKAVAKSKEFEISYGKHKNESKCKTSSFMTNDEHAIIHDLLDAAKPWNSQAISISLLKEIQQRACLIVSARK